MRASTSNGVKHGFFGYLKGLFRRGDASFEINNGSEDGSGATENLPLVPPPVEIALAAAQAAPVTPLTPVAAHPSANLDTMGAGPAPSIAIPLQAILTNLAPELRERVRVQAVGDFTVNVALDKVLSQLAQGQVRIPFGDIRKAAPHVFSPGVDFDRISVALPLNEVLSRINPGLLTRRQAVKQIEVPEEIASPFAGRGEGLSLSVGNAKPVQPAAPKKAAPVPPAPVRGSISAVPRPPAPAALAAANIPAPFAFTPPPPAAPSVPPPAPAARPMSSGQFQQAAPAPMRSAAPALAMPTFPQKPQTPPQVAASPRPAAAAGNQAVITAGLNTLMESWPESLRLEILQTNLNESRIAMPVDVVETALKRGRVTFSWKTIRSWITPAMPTSVSVHDSAELELPLKVIAPLFLARKNSGSTQNKIAVDEAIPNLFFGFPQPEAPAAAPVPTAPVARLAPQAPIAFNPGPSAAAAAASSAAAASAAAAAAAAAAANAAAKPVDTNYYLWDDASETKLFHIEALKQKGSSGTEFVKRYASPNEIVSRAAALDGVAGVLIALPDGLMVASRIPAELNGDTLAAFLPQIFAKVSACTKELRMGELNNVNFTVGNVPWKIFRVNAIFFAAFGNAAQPMPTAQLAALAAELDRKNK